MSSPLDMQTMNNGGVVEAVNIALAKVADNIADVNHRRTSPVPSPSRSPSSPTRAGR